MTSLHICPNCNSEFRGRFCCACGQDQNRSFSTLRQMLGEAFQELTELDGRLARSFATLLFRPGRMTVDYLAHRRERYVPPFRLYLMASVVLYFTLDLLTVQVSLSINLIDDPSTPLNGSPNPAEISLLELLDERLDAAADEPIGGDVQSKTEPGFGSSVFGHVPEISFFLLPFAAMLLKGLYLNRRQPFGEHLVAALHIKTGVFVVLILAAALIGLLELVVNLTGWLPSSYGGVILPVALLTVALYVGVSLCVMYRDNFMLGTARTLLFLSAYLVFTMVGLFAVAVILVF